MAGPREFTPEREETPMTDVEAAFERLIECLEEYNESLTDDQYKRLKKIEKAVGLTELRKQIKRVVS